MSWFRREEFVSGSITLIVSLYEDDESFNDVVSEFSRNNFRRIVIKVGKFSDLNILSPCADQLELLMIQGMVDVSFNGLEKFKELVDLNCDVTSKKPFPDFGKLENLEKCFLAWDKNYDVKNYRHGLFTLPKLKDLTLRHWTKPDCREIAQLQQLEKLDLRQGGLTCLDGLENCFDFKDLHLSYLPKLTDISSLDNLPSLEKIHIQNCPNITDYEPLTGLKNLRHIHLEKVTAQFQELNWLSNMHQLEKICLSCEILKIDWTILFNHPTLRDVAISSHEGYNVSDAEILKIAESAKRQIKNFKRIGTKKKPSFVFDLE